MIRTPSHLSLTTSGHRPVNLIFVSFWKRSCTPNATLPKSPVPVRPLRIHFHAPNVLLFPSLTKIIPFSIQHPLLVITPLLTSLNPPLLPYTVNTHLSYNQPFHSVSHAGSPSFRCSAIRTFNMYVTPLKPSTVKHLQTSNPFHIFYNVVQQMKLEREPFDATLLFKNSHYEIFNLLHLPMEFFNLLLFKSAKTISIHKLSIKHGRWQWTQAIRASSVNHVALSINPARKGNNIWALR